MFLDYLEEAMSNATDLRNDQVKVYFTNLAKIIVESDNFTDEEVLAEMPQTVQDYFYTEFKRCPVCTEWNRIDEMVQARYDVNEVVCEQCREDGN